jgi:hypothetical protein
MIFAMIYLTAIEKKLAAGSIQFSNFACSLDSAGDNVKRMVLEESARNNKINYVLLLSAVFTIFINLPIWADQNELFLCGQVFEYFFGKISKIPYLVYFATMPYLCYAAYRLTFALLYYILGVKVQIFLLNQSILQMSDDLSHLEDFDKIRNVAYQKTMYDRLRFYIRQHCEIKRYFFKLIHKFNSKGYHFTVTWKAFTNWCGKQCHLY